MLRLMKDILTGFWSLIVGLGVTAKTGVEPAVTEQYPNELFDRPLKRHGLPHREVSERFRGLPAIAWNWERDSTTCIGCKACARACPSRCIYDIETEGKGKERRATSFAIDLMMCCYCGLCEEACPVEGKAIFLSRDYETIAHRRDELVVDLDWLSERGKRCRARAEGDEAEASGETTEATAQGA